MSATICQRCGADVRGLVCEYCGVLHHAPTTLAEEREAWVEFLGIMQTKEAEVQINMLRNGFLPENVPTLIDAGLHCVNLLDTSNTADNVVQAAYQRLQAITAKLKILPHTPESDRAIAEFETAIADYRHADSRFNRFLIAGILVTLLICAALLWYLATWLGG